MHTSHKHIFVATLFLAVMSSSVTTADDHVVIERTRSGMGMRFPARSTEIWLNETSVCIKGPGLVTIKRMISRSAGLSPPKRNDTSKPKTAMAMTPSMSGMPV